MSFQVTIPEGINGGAGLAREGNAMLQIWEEDQTKAREERVVRVGKFRVGMRSKRTKLGQTGKGMSKVGIWQQQWGSWKSAWASRERELEVAETEMAKSEHTLWFKKTQWPEHLQGCSMRHLSQATRLADKGETKLQGQWKSTASCLGSM